MGFEGTALAQLAALAPNSILRRDPYALGEGLRRGLSAVPEYVGRTAQRGAQAIGEVPGAVSDLIDYADPYYREAEQATREGQQSLEEGLRSFGSGLIGGDSLRGSAELGSGMTGSAALADPTSAHDTLSGTADVGTMPLRGHAELGSGRLGAALSSAGVNVPQAPAPHVADTGPHIRYQLPGGEWKDWSAGQQPTHGGIVQADAGSLGLGQHDWQDEQRIKEDFSKRTLADPTWMLRAQGGIEAEKAGQMEAARAHARADEERNRTEGYMGRAAQIDDAFTRNRARLMTDKSIDDAERKRRLGELQNAREMAHQQLKTGYGLGERLTSGQLYGY